MLLSSVKCCGENPVSQLLYSVPATEKRKGAQHGEIRNSFNLTPDRRNEEYRIPESCWNNYADVDCLLYFTFSQNILEILVKPMTTSYFLFNNLCRCNIEYLKNVKN